MVLVQPAGEFGGVCAPPIHPPQEELNRYDIFLSGAAAILSLHKKYYKHHAYP